MLSLQDVLLKLTAHWTARGAIMAQPFNTEVGAGTANPATTLRVLGPEPWRVAYVEPSVRPDDARYGLNPNRLQTHTQFQVILKPDPGDPQEQYLASLEAIGIDLAAHDIRFVEDNWASPALGAWGLGWEVWLDGLEITQFTYFQQAGSLTLDPISVEITYGIERIVMALQGVSHFKDIEYAPGISYGEAFGQAEYEMSRFYLDDADIDTQQQLFDLHAAEAQAMLDKRLPLPAYYDILKCSHTFNVLDARGVISTAERARAFATMRRLSHEVAKLWVERREDLGHPLGTIAEAPVPERGPLPTITEPQTLLFEIGVEELPPSEVARGQAWLGSTLTERLAATRLEHGAITTYATPRRMIALVAGVTPREPDACETVRGPRFSAAFDADGQPTKAVLGFAGKHGVEPSALERVVVDGKEHVAVARNLPGRTAAEVLSPLLGQLVVDLRSERNMRWADPKLSYARPVRWLLAKLGTETLPVAASALAGGGTTRVQRRAAAPVIDVPSADGYLDLLRANDVVADVAERRALIVAAAQELAASVGGHVDLEAEAALIEEIANLVEAPTPVLGAFAASYLDLPPEILTTVMRKHQRYVPVRGASGLLAHFITFANGACDVPTVTAGNEAVVRARFEDAAFFWKADSEKSIDDLKAGLQKLAFENTLGSMADRAGRIAIGAGAVADAVGLGSDERATLDRASGLAKFDLASQMVIEMTSLAGTMAGYYARSAGEPEGVAQALEDMEHPRTSDDFVAATLPGAILAVADRADLLAGLFAVGANPTGSSDPFALRRAALGLVATLRAFPAFAVVSVSGLLGVAAGAIRSQGVEVTDDSAAAAKTFVDKRFEQSLLDAGNDVDLVTAVLPLADVPSKAVEALTELAKLRGVEAFDGLVEAVQRIRRLVKDAGVDRFDRTLLDGATAVALVEALDVATAALADDQTITGMVAAAPPLVGATQAFLDDVLIMDKDPAVRAARIGLITAVVALASRSRIDWDALARLRGSS